jgi:hypothetical protein
MDSTRVLTAVRNELETAGLVRRPGNAGPLPALFIEPQGGPPAPGDRDAPETTGELVATLRLSGEGPGRAGAAYVRLFVLDLILRSSTTAGLIAGRTLDTAVRKRLVETSNYGVGKLLDGGGPMPTFALECYVYAGLGPVSDLDGVRTEQSKWGLEVLA